MGTQSGEIPSSYTIRPVPSDEGTYIVVGERQFGGTTNATYNKKSNTITLPAKGSTAAGQTTQIQYPTSSDCGECSQLVEVNQNLAALNKTVEKIECWAWLIVLMLVIVTVIKMFEGRDK